MGTVILPPITFKLKATEVASATTSATMVKYSNGPDNLTKSYKTRGYDLRTQGRQPLSRKMPLVKAKRYLEDVMAHKRAIPFRIFCHGVGCTTHANNKHSNGQCRYPAKSAKFILNLLKMLRVMSRLRDWMSMNSIFLTPKLTRLRNKGVVLIVPMEESIL